MTQPEAIAFVTGYQGGYCVVHPTNPASVLPTGMALSPLEELRSLHAANLDCVAHFDALKADYDALHFALQRIAGRCDAEPAYKIARSALSTTKG